MENIKKIISMRQAANREILNDISNMVEKCPDLRFGQILVNLGIIEYERNTYDETLITKDPFQEESVITLYRMRNQKFFKK
jgi:hypothetical protein